MNISEYKLSEGISLTLYKPSGFGNKKTPIIVLCHGFCGVQKFLLPKYAELFTDSGYAAVTFDYRGFGASDGERGRLEPARQIDDIICVINWIVCQPEIDPERVGLWGTSLGGGHVFGAAMLWKKVKCIVSQLAFSDGGEIITDGMDKLEKSTFISSLDKMSLKKKNTGKEVFVGVTRILNDKASKAFFEENKKSYPEIDIKIPLLTVKEILHYKPALNASKITCPALVVVAENDSVNPPAQGRKLFDAVASKEKMLYVENHADHYDVYSGEYFKRVIRTEIEWFQKYL